MRQLLSIGIFMLFGASFAQTHDNTMLLSDALVNSGLKYQQECSKAMLYNDMERVNFLFDSITNIYLKGTYFDDFEIKKFSGKEISLRKFDKPVMLITLTTWHLLTEGEVRAINELANKYHKDIEFVVLYWGNKRAAKKASKIFNSHLKFTYFDERDNKGAYIVGKIKHIFGFPTFFFLNSDMSIISIDRGGLKKPFYTEQDLVYEANFNKHFSFIKELLVNVKNTGVVTN
ncbi:TlpA family protein disulfide reductase [Neptunitalea lumnitzerae]|uniref:Uncharacterized protein n=1 Tax=Neptunitalea lumnitzerae TaxID=2965509 RepID=A0ABQ5MKF3_9FLAO|nr:TlpA family protein disulfide reductase [Neptunitalea sp. Y10]GLB49879.1 hypothetical protein Y10_22470 [Neptunitalea sp. Y10]